MTGPDDAHTDTGRHADPWAAPAGRAAPVPLVVGIDPVLRDAAVTALLCDVPDAVAVRWDLMPDGRLHRVVLAFGDLVEEAEVSPDTDCASCAVREDLLATVARLVERGTYSTVVAALPVAVEPLPAARGLGIAAGGGAGFRPALRAVAPATVISVVDSSRLVRDLLGDTLVAEAWPLIADDDERAVGEVLAHQIEYADLVLTSGGPTPVGDALLDHLARPGARPRRRIEDIDADSVLATRHDTWAAGDAVDPLHACPTGARDTAGVWTLDLRSVRPVHPGRLVDRIEELGGVPVRGRGAFWLPTRPGTVCVWDGAGGQLSIGGAGDRWPGRPLTRLVLTGLTADGELGADRRRLREVFADVLLTEAELSLGPDHWDTVDDGMDQWLGSRTG